MLLFQLSPQRRQIIDVIALAEASAVIIRLLEYNFTSILIITGQSLYNHYAIIIHVDDVLYVCVKFSMHVLSNICISHGNLFFFPECNVRLLSFVNFVMIYLVQEVQQFS